MMPPSGASNATPFRLVARYLMTSVCFFVALCLYATLAWEDIHGHVFQPRILALTHIATLGWITMAIFGAMFQLVPVVLGVPLWSARMAAWQYWVFLAGVVGIVVGFWTFAVGWVIDAAALALFVAGCLFLWNMMRTLVKVRTWDITARFLLAALGYFFITITLGATLALNLGHAFISRSHIDFLKIHAHFGLLGWVAMVIMGVATRVVPMFAVAHGFSRKPATIAFWCVNIGLLGAMVELTFGATSILMAYVVIAFAGLLAYAIQIAIVLKMRLRRTLDALMRHVAVSFGMMTVAAALCAVAVFGGLSRANHDQIVLAYGIAALVGFMSSLIVGMMYKIIPFLVWYTKFAPRAGTERVPLLSEMVHAGQAAIAWWLFLAGTCGMIAGAAIGMQAVFGAGAALLFVASLLFVYNIARVFQYQ